MTWNVYLTGDYIVPVFSESPPPKIEWPSVAEVDLAIFLMQLAKASPPPDTEPFAEEGTKDEQSNS